MRKNVIAGIGNTDHLSFRAVGVPGFNPIQEYKDYDVRMHHTNVDMYERVREQDLEAERRRDGVVRVAGRDHGRAHSPALTRAWRQPRSAPAS